MDFICVIPARERSKRLPRKLLIKISGREIINHTVLACLRSDAKNVFVATDSRKIKKAVEDFSSALPEELKNKLEVRIIRGSKIKTGSDRVGELIRRLELEGRDPPEIVVNVQGDEPMITPSIINSVAHALERDKRADIATYGFWSSSRSELENPNRVKIVVDSEFFAIYFSRSPVPSGAKRYVIHTGIYAFRKESLRRFLNLPQTKNEKTERLEQLRALENGMRIKVLIGRRKLVPVDTRKDLKLILSTGKRKTPAK